MNTKGFLPSFGRSKARDSVSFKIPSLERVCVTFIVQVLKRESAQHVMEGYKSIFYKSTHVNGRMGLSVMISDSQD